MWNANASPAEAVRRLVSTNMGLPAKDTADLASIQSSCVVNVFVPGARVTVLLIFSGALRMK